MHSESTLKQIERDAVYKNFRAQVRSAMTTRLRRALDMACSAADAEPVILFRGSYGYGHPAAHSDLDVVVISEKPEANTSASIHAAAIRADLNCSALHYSISDLDRHRRCLTFWLAECVMNHSSKAIEIEDVEFRVSELERVAEAQKRK